MNWWFLATVASFGLVLFFTAVWAWERFKVMAARTAQPGGDHFILDRDSPVEKR